MGDTVYEPKLPQEVNGFPVVGAIKDSTESFIVVADRGLEHTERRTLAETVAKVREMHRLYPFTRFESSAGKKARRRRGT